MTTFNVRYAAMIGGVMAFFVQFVACGSQLYKVSLQDDSQPRAEQAIGNPSVNDPSSYTFGLHAPKGWKNIPIHFKTARDLSTDQIAGITRAMLLWETAVGKKLFIYDGVDAAHTGDDFRDLYGSLDDGTNGHYLDNNWTKTGKPEVVLATTIWDNEPDDGQYIRTSDLRFNGQFYKIGDAFTLQTTDAREVVDMTTLALHELGHHLGLAHISATIDPNSIMTASLYIGEGLANRHLSEGDVERIQKIYGCQGTACDTERTIARIDEMDRKSRASLISKEEDSESTQSAH